ncbi:MAG: tetraacyldisaccharide 4'-kinase [Puniceicoccales bacterium]|jgi:tetraacyldisaccharide 4'-kinase|nr:tetraacyldisaccharide 4'-kinase [Puniceicoccales bacterium]
MSSRVTHDIQSKAERFVQFTADVIYDRHPGSPLVTAYATFLKGISYIFALAVRIRFFLYDNRILQDTPLGCKVVVVGNITMGGTGKTPVTEKMARVLSERGRKVAILSRGYKSRSDPLVKKFWRWLTHGEKPAPRVVSDGTKLLLDSDEAGDEPYMLARNLLPLGVVVIVNKNRVEAGVFALKKFHIDTILLDDGMQYLPLRGQINLLLIDKTNPFGNGNMIPRGILREPIRNIRRGSYVFLTKSDGVPDPSLVKTIQDNNAGVHIIECTHQPKLLSSLDGLVMLPLDYLKGRRVATFSGIATPERFEDFVRRYGGQILYNQRFLDHHRFSENDLVDVFDEAVASDAEFVVTTEKDAVRIDQTKKRKLPLYYLRLEIEILDGGEAFNRAVDRICEGKNGYKK